jgi:hypothetical protein
MLAGMREGTQGMQAGRLMLGGMRGGNPGRQGQLGKQEGQLRQQGQQQVRQGQLLLQLTGWRMGRSGRLGGVKVRGLEKHLSWK